MFGLVRSDVASPRSNCVSEPQLALSRDPSMAMEPVKPPAHRKVSVLSRPVDGTSETRSIDDCGPLAFGGIVGNERKLFAPKVPP